jgi:hypothetical protein
MPIAASFPYKQQAYAANAAAKPVLYTFCLYYSTKGGFVKWGTVAGSVAPQAFWMSCKPCADFL